MKPALLVIDVQEAFFGEDSVTDQTLKTSVAYINELVKIFREKKLPISYIQHMDEEDGVIPGTPGFELPKAFDVQPGDIRITKTYGNAFNKTTLEKDLKDLGVDTVFIVGYCAEFCILSTCRGANDVDLKPILVRNALASGSLENIKFVESVNEIISLGALHRLLS